MWVCVYVICQAQERDISVNSSRKGKTWVFLNERLFKGRMMMRDSFFERIEILFLKMNLFEMKCSFALLRMMMRDT